MFYGETQRSHMAEICEKLPLAPTFEYKLCRTELINLGQLNLHLECIAGEHCANFVVSTAYYLQIAFEFIKVC